MTSVTGHSVTRTHTIGRLSCGLRRSARTRVYPLETDHEFSYTHQVVPTPVDKGQKEHVAVRLDAATVARLAALLPLYALPGRPATRSDGLRAVILAGLAVEEERAARNRAPDDEGSEGSKSE
jgi:hypothetical protein